VGATSTSLEVYLASHPRPGVDYVDGVLEERNVGENDHSWLQFEIGRLLYQAGFHIVRPGLRLCIRLDRYRVPDVCIFQEPPTEQVPTKPPLPWPPPPERWRTPPSPRCASRSPISDSEVWPECPKGPGSPGR